MRSVGLVLCLFMFRFPLIHLKVQLLDLLLEFALILFGCFYVLLQLLLQILTGGLKVGKIGLELRILGFVPF